MMDTRYEKVSGSGDYMTYREVLERSGRGDRIEDFAPSWRSSDLVSSYWKIKDILGSIDDPVTPQVLSAYNAELGFLLKRDERAIIYRMDATMRRELSKKRAANDKALADKAKNK
jgi:hypothetical protein